MSIVSKNEKNTTYLHYRTPFRSDLERSGVYLMQYASSFKALWVYFLQPACQPNMELQSFQTDPSDSKSIVKVDLFTNTFSQTPFCLYVLFYCVPFVFVVLYIICICKRFENKTQIKVTIKDASTAGKVGFELLSGNALSSSSSVQVTLGDARPARLICGR